MNTENAFDYALLDCGNGVRIERFGSRIIRRPCPMVSEKMIHPQWLTSAVDAEFFVDDAGKQWQKAEDISDTWNISVNDVVAELRFSRNGQVGLFPEQLGNWRWIARQVAKSNKPLRILNGFAYTGMSTLHASASHTEVCHVDGAKSAITWAKKNAELSGLRDANIRWICDDVVRFMEREIKRGRRYDAVILDPPAFGRGGGQTWKIEKDTPRLMHAVEELLVDNPAFVVLSCHAPRHFSMQSLADMLEQMPQWHRQKAEQTLLQIPSKNGNNLNASFGARISRFDA